MRIQRSCSSVKHDSLAHHSCVLTSESNLAMFDMESNVALDQEFGLESIAVIFSSELHACDTVSRLLSKPAAHAALSTILEHLSSTASIPASGPQQMLCCSGDPGIHCLPGIAPEANEAQEHTSLQLGPAQLQLQSGC